MAKHCNTWRNWDDIQPHWGTPGGSPPGVSGIIDYWGGHKHEVWSDYDRMVEAARPGAWWAPRATLLRKHTICLRPPMAGRAGMTPTC